MTRILILCLGLRKLTETPHEWLSARERCDRVARSDRLAALFASSITAETLIVDLGCGTGANHRYLAPYLRRDQKWLCIDHDTELLARGKATLGSPNVQFADRDLSGDLPDLPGGPNVAITASAFLDITSRQWVKNFALHCRDTPLLLSMTVSGPPVWEPHDSNDETICRALSDHQKSDHGFGPALGSDATDCLADQLHSQGCAVALARTDWNLTFSDSPLMERMVGGIARRMRAMRVPFDIDAWEDGRLQQVKNRQLTLCLPHLDLHSLPKRLLKMQ